VNTTIDLEIVEAFESIGIDPVRAMKAAAAFNKSDDNRMGRMEGDIKDVKADIRDLKADIKRIDVRIELHTWMLGFIFAGISALSIKTFFH